MRHLTKIFLLLTLVLMSFMSIASAKNSDPNELEYIKAYQTREGGREFLRIEIGFKGEELEYDIKLASSISQLMTVDLKHTIPAKVGRRGGSNIDFEEPVENITLKEFELGSCRLQINFDKTIDDRSYRARVEKANKSQKLPTRLLIDIDNYVFIDETIELDIGSGAIVIDPGHGGSDAGAVGPTGVREKDVSLAVALKLREYLEEQGDPVVMTRTTDVDVYSPQATNAQELQARVNKAPRDAALFISIHCNAFSNPSSHGMETYYYTDSGRGRRLAKLINEELEKYGGLFNRGVKPANFYVLKHTSMPSTLLELGFVTNPEEEQLLADEGYQDSLARAIVTGINRYFGRTTD
ncbi:MAG: N-acetylmuramoyl-L-alanine amidase [Selenomonadaceae bacterium]|nr:N-acetylmuramoyl-L-alanine amidase [Selenomonadaceae bacterium]